MTIKKTKRVSLSAFTAGLESVTNADDKNVSTSVTPLKDSKADLTGTIVPNEEVSATDKSVKTTAPGPADGGGNGKAETVDVKKVDARLPKADAANTAEVDAVNIKTADTVKAGEKDLTTGVSTENIETNEAEHIEPAVTDEMVMDVEHAATVLDGGDLTAATDRVLDEADVVAEDLAKIDTVAAALEKYSVLLTGMVKRGKLVDADTAGAIKIALEAFDHNEFARTVPSLEAFGRKSSQLTVSIELLDNVKSKLKAVGAGAKEALKKLFELMVQLWHNFTTDIGKLKGRIDDLRTSEYVDADTTVPLTSAGRLSIDGEFVGFDADAIRLVSRVADRLLGAWPVALSSVLFAKPNATMDELKDLAKKAVTESFTGFDLVNSGDVPSEVDGFHVTRSPVLPGDKALFVGMTTEVFGGNYVGRMEGILSLYFGDASKGGEKDSGEIKVPREDVCRKIASHLLDICTIVEENKHMTTLVKSVLAQVGKDTGKATTDARLACARASVVGQKAFIGYLMGTVKAYVALLESITVKAVTSKADE